LAISAGADRPGNVLWSWPLFRVLSHGLEIVHVGDKGEIPNYFYLSDGGHFENLGLLPLLQRKVKTIVIADGSNDEQQDCLELFNALDFGREKLGCHFLHFENKQDTDLYTDFFEKFRGKDKTLRSYRFRVKYYDGSEGVIIYLKPRAVEPTEEERKSATNHPNRDIHGCCCNCCHTQVCIVSEPLFGSFPNHSSVNQLFTPELFAAYNEEGYICAGKAANLFL